MPKRKREAEAIPWELVRRTLAFLRSHRAHLAISIVSTTAVAVVWFAGPYFLRRLIDTVIASEFDVFAWLVAASFAFALLEMGAVYVKRGPCLRG